MCRCRIFHVKWYMWNKLQIWWIYEYDEQFDDWSRKIAVNWKFGNEYQFNNVVKSMQQEVIFEVAVNQTEGHDKHWARCCFFCKIKIHTHPNNQLNFRVPPSSTLILTFSARFRCCVICDCAHDIFVRNQMYFLFDTPSATQHYTHLTAHG